MDVACVLRHVQPLLNKYLNTVDSWKVSRAVCRTLLYDGQLLPSLLDRTAYFYVCRLRRGERFSDTYMTSQCLLVLCSPSQGALHFRRLCRSPSNDKQFKEATMPIVIHGKLSLLLSYEDLLASIRSILQFVVDDDGGFSSSRVIKFCV